MNVFWSYDSAEEQTQKNLKNARADLAMLDTQVAYFTKVNKPTMVERYQGQRDQLRAMVAHLEDPANTPPPTATDLLHRNYIKILPTAVKNT